MIFGCRETRVSRGNPPVCHVDHITILLGVKTRPVEQAGRTGWFMLDVRVRFLKN